MSHSAQKDENTKIGALEGLAEALRVIPGIGHKSAQRIAFDLLLHQQQAGVHLAESLLRAYRELVHCKQCNTLTDQEICHVCSNPDRDHSLLCVVQTPADQLMIEQTQTYYGLYFVLAGALSPLEGHKGSDIGLEALLERVQHTHIPIKELVIATHFTNEGELTAHVIAENIATTTPNLNISRLAKGIPIGSELEQIDLGTLASSMLHRQDKF